MTREPLPEDPTERRMFDSSSKLHGGSLQNVAVTLTIWARMEMRQHPGASYGNTMAIMANEIWDAIDERRAKTAKRKGRKP